MTCSTMCYNWRLVIKGDVTGRKYLGLRCLDLFRGGIFPFRDTFLRGPLLNGTTRINYAGHL